MNPLTAVLGNTGSLVNLIGIVIGGLCLAGAPAYLFEDVMDIPGAKAWFFGGIVWIIATLFLNGASELNLMASVTLQDFTGISIDAPLTIGAGLLAAFYFLAAYGEYTEENENRQSSRT
jgi:hypothetical protein